MHRARGLLRVPSTEFHSTITIQSQYIKNNACLESPPAVLVAHKIIASTCLANYLSICVEKATLRDCKQHIRNTYVPY